ncbi:nitroreductase family protein [Sporomusa acidovorans]|uniref:Bifunctional F420 biosynthesis protein FbiB n=1 Tax=Sporomusa acidovorans (strain ATCC 49682 / DSM 3132 / Mol) TaxID=1123286 RepID=A0ABZ3IYU6_SPOA4|nr:nitroreductase family protein [Sporomusa acidovorans]OZC14168.1 NADH dehydrogenase [Sporomusa acidovorans DSM 3132]SDE70256.1 Nitroreductase [Sporomusa acidovorans]
MNLDFIYKRHSVRKFTEEQVPEQTIKELIKAAIHAPSGKNQQNWHFVVVTNKEKIAEIARIVEMKNAELSTYLRDEAKIKGFKGTVGYHTVFKGAPVLVLVYAGPYDTIADMLLADGVMPREEAIKYTKPNPGIQNIAAALENLQLAAANLGYGTCWMTGPTYAAEEISAYIGFKKDGYHLAAMSPLGVPATDKLSSPPRKPLEDVLTIIS